MLSGILSNYNSLLIKNYNKDPGINTNPGVSSNPLSHLFDAKIGNSENAYLSDISELEDDAKPADINGEIETAAQGEIGDCWLLAGLNSLSYSKTGSNIIKNAITSNKDGSFTVNFKGVNASYTISSSELSSAKQNNDYSKGDSDVLLIEIAAEKFLKELRAGEINIPENAPQFLSEEDLSPNANPLDGGTAEHLLYLFTGKEADIQIQDKDPDSILDKNNPFILDGFGTDIDYALDIMKNDGDNTWGTITIDTSNVNSCTIKDVYGNNMNLFTGGTHAWSLKSAEGDNITIVNPWDSSDEITVSRDSISPFISRVFYQSLS